MFQCFSPLTLTSSYQFQENYIDLAFAWSGAAKYVYPWRLTDVDTWHPFFCGAAIYNSISRQTGYLAMVPTGPKSTSSTTHKINQNRHVKPWFPEEKGSHHYWWISYIYICQFTEGIWRVKKHPHEPRPAGGISHSPSETLCERKASTRSARWLWLVARGRSDAGTFVYNRIILCGIHNNEPGPICGLLL